MTEDNETDTELLQTFKDDVAADYAVTEDQREACKEDMRFCNVDGGMWEDFLQDTYSGKAKLEFDLTSDFVNRYVGEWNQNSANVTFVPDDDHTTEDDAELVAGIYRDDFRNNDGKLSHDNAVLEAAQCGIGAFKISTGYEDEEDAEDERQKVVFEPIFNAFDQVIWGANAKRIDKADATRCTVLTAYTKSAFKAEWPDASETSAYTPSNKNSFTWTDQDIIYVAERYEVKKKKETVCIFQNEEQELIERYLSTDTDSIEAREKDPEWSKVREKKVITRYVEKSIFTGNEFLEEPKRIAGKFIPIIPVYAYRSFVDNEEHCHGLVRKRKDANRLFNMNVSRMAESAASSSDTIPILTQDQVEGHEGNWQDRLNKSYMLINDAEDADGNKIPTGPVGYLQPSQVDPNTIATTDIVNNFIQRLNGNAPQDSVDPDASGVAIDKLKQRDNLNTQIVTDNALTSISHSGRVYLSIAADIYSQPMSKATTSEDGTNSRVQLHQTVMDKETGQMKVINDISKGKFKVISETAPQYQTQREATARSVEAAMKAVGPESKYFGPLMAIWMENITGTGLKPLKEFNRKEMLRMQLIEPETPEEKQMMATLAQEIDPQKQLTESITNQQNADAKNLEASSVQKLADAKKKQAEAVQITENINNDFIERRLKQLAS